MPTKPALNGCGIGTLIRCAHDDERSAVEAGAAPLRLLAALELIEAMGGTLSHRTCSGGPEYVARLPRGGVLRVTVPSGAVRVSVATVPV